MDDKTIKAGIIGGAGYTGGETIRLLLNHPDVTIAYVHSRSNAGKPLAGIHTDLVGETNMLFTSEVEYDVDVLFLCVGHGEAKAFLQQHTLPAHLVVIDLSQDYRLLANANEDGRQFVYGLPEINREEIRTSKSIANPGCFATAIQLAMLPLASKGLLNDVHVTGITGSTGAGQQLQPTSHFSWRANNIQAYKTLTHQHTHEIKQTLNSLQAGFSKLHFVPWRGDFTRGIYVSAYTDCSLSIEEACELYNDFYLSHPFTQVSEKMIHLKQVVNTNKCLIHLEKVEDKLIVHTAIDNLLKGASGQAVQNMNLVFGFPETTGLKLKSVSF